MVFLYRATKQRAAWEKLLHLPHRDAMFIQRKQGEGHLRGPSAKSLWLCLPEQGAAKLVVLFSSLYPCTQTRVRYTGPLREKQMRRGSQQSIFLWGFCFERSRKPDSMVQVSQNTVTDSVFLELEWECWWEHFAPWKERSINPQQTAVLSHSRVTEDKNVNPLIRLDHLLA